MTLIKFEHRLVLSADATVAIPDEEAGAEYLTEPVGDASDEKTGEMSMIHPGGQPIGSQRREVRVRFACINKGTKRHGMISQSQHRLNPTPARQRLLRWLAILLTLLYGLFPLYWLTNNLALLDSERFAAGLAKLLIVSSGSVALTLLFGAVAAYGVGRLGFRGQALLRYMVLVLITLPPLALMAGLYLFFPNPCRVDGGPCRPFALYSTLWPLILAYLLTLPLTLWLLAAGFRDLPRKLKKIAAADGAAPWQTFYRLILPLAAPGLVTAGLLAFITGWNGFLWSVGFTSNDKYRAAPIAISLFGNIGFSVLVALAAALIVSAPLVLLALVFQRQPTADPTDVAGPADAHRWRQWLARCHGAWLALSNSARVLLVVLALGAFVFVAEGWRVLTFPYALDYGEAPLLDQTQRLAHGQSIYRADLQLSPYTIANYPPLYMLAQAPLAWLFGPAFWYGRLLSWLAMSGAALFVGLILRTLTGDRLAALVGGLTLLALPYTRYWAPLYRIDALALCLSLAALWVVMRYFPSTEDAPRTDTPLLRDRHGSDDRPWWPSWAVVGVALLLVAAVYTRQSYGLAAPLAAFVWLWSNGRRQQALALTGLVAALGLSLFVLLNGVTGGGFYFNIVTANINEVKVALLQQYLGELVTFMLVPVLITALFVLLLGIAKGRPRAWRLLLPYIVGAALAGLTIGKVGSNINYLLEFCVAMSFAVGAMLAWQRHLPPIRRLLMLGLALQLFLLLPGMSYQLFSQFRLDSRADMALIAERIRSTDGPVLADEDLGQLVLAGRPLLFQPFELTQLARAGKWEQTPLLAAIERQEYALILIFKFPGLSLDRDRWTDEMLAAIDRRYRAVEEIGYTVVYRSQ